jgi:glycosyltransferase involved in cell wall biosynthesis
MHVLYVIDSLFGGGAEQSLAVLAPHLVRGGVELEVLYFHERDDGLKSALLCAGARVHALGGNRRIAMQQLRARQRTRRPDLVHTTLFEADVIARIANLGTSIPIVTSLVNEAYGPEQLRNPQLRGWKVRAAQLMDAITARRVTRFHAVSSNVARVMGSRLHIPPSRIDVIPRGRDAEALGRRNPERRTKVRARLGLAPDDVMLLSVGRHEYQKGIDLVIGALPAVRAKHATAKLFVAGREGNATTLLHTTAQAEGVADDVRFLGYRADVPDLLCAADVFVLPSRWEGSPGSVIEAMALEVPIVASDIPAVREVAGSGDTALLAPPEDANALGEAIVAALDDPGSRTRVQAARERFLDSFTADRVARQMIALYERAARV